MCTAKIGDTVKLLYTGTLEDGREFGISGDREPIEITLGDGAMVSGFEFGIEGMKKGEKKTIVLSPENGYGQKKEELIATLSIDKFPDDLELYTGMRLKLRTEDETDIIATVVEITEDSVTVDANPPLAGETVTFVVELVDIVG